MLITAATINLRNRHDRWRQRRHLLVAELVDTQPDLISLQEIHFPSGQGRWLKNQINARLSGDSQRPYFLIQRRKRHWRAGYSEGIGILTKFPTIYDEVIPLGYNGRLAIRAHIELPTRRGLDFVATHLHHISHDQQARQEQVMRLVSHLTTQRPTPYQIIAGDFNELPPNPAIQQMKQAYNSAYQLANGYEPLATFPTALTIATSNGWSGCLDYIFVSKAIPTVQSAKLFCKTPAADDENLYPSDHVGILAKIEV